MTDAKVRWVATVSALGIAQIVSWGTLYYAIAVLAAPIQSDTGYSELQIVGAFSVALALSGIAAPLAGRLIDRYGGRSVMTAGSAIAAIAFFTIGTSTEFSGFLAGWLIAGVAMSACLYDAAFAMLNRGIPVIHYRSAVTVLTLFGGFASTLFWPATHALLQGLGDWRPICILYAGAHLCVCLPLHWLAIPRVSDAARAAARPDSGGDVRPAATRTMRTLALAFAANTFVFSVMSVYLIRMLDARGLDASHAIVLASLIGPFQVAARVLEFALSGRISAIAAGTASFAMLSASLGVFLLVDGPGAAAFAFVGLYGASNGVMTIARGTVPAELFGREGYGATLGRLALPSLIAKALAPGAFALLLASGLGFNDGMRLLAGTAVLGWLSYAVATGVRASPRSS